MTNQDKNTQNEDVSFYEKLVTRTEELIASGKKNLDEAMKKASEELAAAESFTKEKAENIATFVKRDFQLAVDQAHRAKESIKEVVDPQRVSAGAQSVFSKLLQTTSEKLSDLAQKSEQNLEFKTGEITSAGTLTCKNCQEQLHIKRTSKIPPCPKCHQTLYRKSY